MIDKGNATAAELTSKGMRRIAHRMLESKSKGVRLTGEKLVLLDVFGEFNLKTLGYRIAWSHPSAAEELEGAITALENNVDVSPPYVWEMVMRAYESHLANGDVEKVGAAWQRLWALSQKIQSEDSKKYVQVKLQRQKHRAISVGSTFDLSGTRLTNGKPVDLSNFNYVAVIFCDEGTDSVNIVNQVVNGKKLNHPDLHVVLAFKQVFSKEETAKINDSRGDFTVVGVDTARKYYEKLLVDIAPYIVLVDSSGEILRTGLKYDQLETRVARMKTNRSVSATTKP